jgi:hypothetical protein
MIKNRVFRITVPSTDVQHFLGECEAASWFAYDTGERVMTDEGPDAEAVLLVEPSARATTHEREVVVQ